MPDVYVLILSLCSALRYHWRTASLTQVWEWFCSAKDHVRKVHVSLGQQLVRAVGLGLLLVALSGCSERFSRWEHDNTLAVLASIFMYNIPLKVCYTVLVILASFYALRTHRSRQTLRLLCIAAFIGLVLLMCDITFLSEVMFESDLSISEILFWRYLNVLSMAGLLFSLRILLRRMTKHATLFWAPLAHFLGLMALGNEVVQWILITRADRTEYTFDYNVGLLYCTTYALIVLAYGIFRQQRVHRLCAIIIYVLAVVYPLWYHLGTLNSTGTTIAGIGIGVFLLLNFIQLQQRKRLIVDTTTIASSTSPASAQQMAMKQDHLIDESSSQTQPDSDSAMPDSTDQPPTTE